MLKLLLVAFVGTVILIITDQVTGFQVTKNMPYWIHQFVTMAAGAAIWVATGASKKVEQ
jgi:hypothetical protein